MDSFEVQDMNKSMVTNTRDGDWNKGKVKGEASPEDPPDKKRIIAHDIDTCGVENDSGDADDDPRAMVSMNGFESTSKHSLAGSDLMCEELGVDSASSSLRGDDMSKDDKVIKELNRNVKATTTNQYDGESQSTTSSRDGVKEALVELMEACNDDPGMLEGFKEWMAAQRRLGREATDGGDGDAPSAGGTPLPLARWRPRKPLVAGACGGDRRPAPPTPRGYGGRGGDGAGDIVSFILIVLLISSRLNLG